MDELVELGRTAGAYGFRGWVRIIPLESGEVLQKVKRWVLTDLKGVQTPLQIEGIRRHGDGFVVKWVGCDTKEAADAVRGRVSVARADFPSAGDDAVWAVDLIDCSVVNLEGQTLGRVSAVGSNGAQDLLIVEYSPVEGKTSQFMIPLVKDVYLKTVDTEAGVVTVDWQADWR